MYRCSVVIDLALKHLDSFNQPPVFPAGVNEWSLFPYSLLHPPPYYFFNQTFHLLKDIWKLEHPSTYFQSLQLTAKMYSCTGLLLLFYYYYYYFSFWTNCVTVSAVFNLCVCFCLFSLRFFLIIIIIIIIIIKYCLSSFWFCIIQFGFSGVLWVNCQEKLLRVCPCRKCQCECECTIYNNKVFTLHLTLTIHVCLRGYLYVCVPLYVVWMSLVQREQSCWFSLMTRWSSGYHDELTIKCSV